MEYDIIKYITYKSDLLYDYGNKFIGKYDKRTNNGLITFDEESIEEDFLGRDKYYLIIIHNSYSVNLSYSLEIHSSSKNSIQSILPINKYISGSFNLIKNKTQSQKYYIKKFDNNKDFVIDFSSNYKNIHLIFNNNSIICNNTKREGGKEKYFITINSQNDNDTFFEVALIDDKINNEINSIDINYIIKYYNYNDETKEKKYNFDLSYTLKKIEGKK